MALQISIVEQPIKFTVFMDERLTGLKVLIVDDDERNTFALASYLETLDYTITIANSGLHAIEQLKSGSSFDIILLDMMMPGMDGYETLAEFGKNETWKKIPVLAVTAKAMKGDEEKCREAGAWDYVSKPIDMQLLIEKMTQWV